MRDRRFALLVAVAVMVFVFGTALLAQEQCVPFGGTIYGWHSGKAWIGEGDFTIGQQTEHAKVVDTNTSLVRAGNMWRGTETAVFDFGNGNKIELMTEFVTEHQTDAVSATGLFHVNEVGYFKNGTGKLKNAWGRFSSQGPFGPGVTLPAEVKPTENDGMFWIGQYTGNVCGVSAFAFGAEKKN